MGSGASTAVPADIVQMYEALEKIKTEVSSRDETSLRKELGALFHSHQNIIKILSFRTKSQLKRFVGKSLPMKELQSLESGTYGRFLASLADSRAANAYKLIETSIMGIGCDICGLTSILCTLNATEMDELLDIFEERSKSINGAVTLEALLAKKTKKRSVIQRFLLMVISDDIAASAALVNELDEHTVSNYANIIANGTLQNIDEVLNVMVACSRYQFQAIDHFCQTIWKKSLVDILATRFSGDIAKAMTLYTLPIYEAYAYVLLENAKNSEFIAIFLGGFNRLQWREIDKVMTLKHKTPLKSFLSERFSGNFRTFLLNYLDGKTIDEGYEELIDEYVKNQLRFLGPNASLLELLADFHHYSHIKVMLAKEIDAYAKNGFSSDLSADVLRNTDYFNSVSEESKGIGQETGNYASNSLPPVHIAQRGEGFLENMSQKYQGQQQQHSDDEYRLAHKYLETLYCYYDSERTGYVTANLFWQFFDAISFCSYSFTAEEVAGMKQWYGAEWVVDGHVSLSDCCAELAQQLITGMRGQGLDISSTLQASVDMLKADLSSKSVSSLPDAVKTYLSDTVAFYDRRQSGYLQPEDMAELLRVMNLPLNEEDVYSYLGMEETSGMRTADLVARFSELFQELTNNRRDCWIGFYDTAANAWFWYNLLNNASQWMSQA